MFRLIKTSSLLAIAMSIGCSRPSENVNAGSGPAASAADDVAITEADVVPPKDYAEMVSRIVGYRDAIRSAISTGKPTKAHRPLDEFDIILPRLLPLARASGIAKQRWEAINLAGKQLETAFHQLHAAIDENRMPDYSAVESDIDSAIESLKSSAK